MQLHLVQNFLVKSYSFVSRDFCCVEEGGRLLPAGGNALIVDSDYGPPFMANSKQWHIRRRREDMSIISAF